MFRVRTTTHRSWLMDLIMAPFVRSPRFLRLRLRSDALRPSVATSQLRFIYTEVFCYRCQGSSSHEPFCVFTSSCAPCGYVMTAMLLVTRSLPMHRYITRSDHSVTLCIGNDMVRALMPVASQTSLMPLP